MKLTSRVLLFTARHIPRGYWRLIRFAAQRDAALWDLPLSLRYLPDIRIRADLREPVFASFVRYGCFPYQGGEDLLCMRLLRAGDVVFDVGANIGYPAVLFSNLVGGEGRVMALEPSVRAFRLLQRTVGGQPNVKCLNLAASDHVGDTPFYEAETLVTSSIMPIANVEPYFIKTTTLDQVAEQFGIPTFVKIDVESHEPAVFKGMARLLQRDRPPIVLFEALSGSALQDTLSVLDRLARDRYVVFRVKPNGTVGLLNDSSGTNNYLAVPGWATDRISPIPSSSGWIDSERVRVMSQ